MQFQRLWRIEKRRWLYVVGLVALTHLFCQSLMLPYGTALLSLLPGDELPKQYMGTFLSGSSSVKSILVRQSILVNASDSVDATLIVGLVENVDNVGGETGRSRGQMGNNRSMENEFNLGMNDPENTNEHDQDRKGEKDFSKDFVDLNDDYVVDHDLDFVSFSDKANGSTQSLPLEHIVEPSDGTSEEDILEADTNVIPEKVGTTNFTSLVNLVSNVSIAIGSAALKRSSGGAEIRQLSKDESHLKLQSGIGMLINTSTTMNNTTTKKLRCDMPPKSVMSMYEMNQLLVRHRRSSRAMVSISFLYAKPFSLSKNALFLLQLTLLLVCIGL